MTSVAKAVAVVTFLASLPAVPLVLSLFVNVWAGPIVAPFWAIVWFASYAWLERNT